MNCDPVLYQRLFSFFWSSRSLYFNSTWIWINLSYCNKGKKEIFGNLGIIYAILGIGFLVLSFQHVIYSQLD